MKRMGWKPKKSQRRKTKRKQGKSRRRYRAVAGNDRVVFSKEELVLENVVNDDARLLNFHKHPHNSILITNSPSLTHIPFLGIEGRIGKITLTINSCPALQSISYLHLYLVQFIKMKITHDVIKQKFFKNTLVTDYCVNYRFRECTFESGCAIYYLSSFPNSIVFNFCIHGIPQFSTMFLSRLSILYCKKVHFPNLNWPNNCTYIHVNKNEYINYSVKKRFSKFMEDMFEDRPLTVFVSSDIELDEENERIESIEPVDFDIYSRYNNWKPPNPTWGSYIPEIVPSNITLDTLLYDFIEGDISLRNYLDANPINDEDIIFFKMNSDYFITDLNRLQVEIGKLGMDNSTIVYECKEANGSCNENNVIFDKPYFKLADITGTNRIYVPLNEIEYMIAHPTCKFWEGYTSTVKLISVVSLAIISGKTRVGGSHCQLEQGGYIFHLRKLSVSEKLGI